MLLFGGQAVESDHSLPILLHMGSPATRPRRLNMPPGRYVFLSANDQWLILNI